jgi:hypothetical protein
MRFYLLVHRQEGRMRARWQIGGARGLLGELEVRDGDDTTLRRRTRIARFFDSSQPLKDLVPPLKDATLLYIDHRRMVLCGFERINERDFAQTWMLADAEDALHALG